MPFFTFDYQQTLDETISLDDLSNVTVASPLESDVLAYDSATSTWKNQDMFATVEDATRIYIHTNPRYIQSQAVTIEPNVMRFATFVPRYKMTLTKVTACKLGVVKNKNISYEPALARLDSSGNRITSTGSPLTSETLSGYAPGSNPTLEFGGKRFFALYELTVDSSYKIVSATRIATTIDDQSIFDHQNQTSQKLFTSPVTVYPNKVYAVGYLFTGYIDGPVCECFAQNYAESNKYVASTPNIPQYGIAPGLQFYAGGIKTVKVAPNQMSHSGTTATLRFPYATTGKVYGRPGVGNRLVVSGIGAGYDGIHTIDSVTYSSYQTSTVEPTSVTVTYTTATSLNQSATTPPATASAIIGNILSEPPAYIDGQLTPKTISSVRRDGPNRICYATLNNVINLHVGQRVTVEGVTGANAGLFNTSGYIVSIAGNEIGYVTVFTPFTDVSATSTSGTVKSSAMINYEYSAAEAKATTFRRPFFRLEV